MKNKWLFLTIFVLICFSFAVVVHAQDNENLVTEKIFLVSNTGEAIGVKVMENSTWLTPKQWYKKFAPNPKNNPSYITVDNFLAIKDGRTVYVGAVDIKDEDTNNPKVYPRIYLISYSEGASGETRQIYDYLLESWEFNTNIENDVYKNEFKKDLLRIYDLEQIKSLLESYHSVKGNYPVLSSGTYIEGQTTSKWPSWQNTFGQELGGINLPVDPINEFNGLCSGCGEGQCQGTCYNPLTKEFFHNKGSHIYKYIIPTKEGCEEGGSYVLSVNLEYKPGNVDEVTWVGDRNVDVTSSDEDINANFFYSSTSVCGDNVLECGEVCDGSSNSQPNAYCNEDTSCQGWDCNDLYGDCNDDLTEEDCSNGCDGCEAYLGDDVENCGQCNNVCELIDNAQVLCVNGECSWECNDGFRKYNNVCEYDHCISSDKEIGEEVDQDCSDEISNGSGMRTRECQDLHPPQLSTGDDCVITSCDEGFIEEDGECVSDAPEPPTSFSASINSDNPVSKIDLEWTDNSANENGFSLERKIGSENWIEVKSDLSANLQSFIDDNLTANTTYLYKLSAYNNAGDSSASNEPSVTTYTCNPQETETQACNITNGTGTQERTCQTNGEWGNWGDCTLFDCDPGYEQQGNSCVVMSPPTNLLANVISSTVIELNWNDNAVTTTHFKLKRDNNIIDNNIQTNEYADSALQPNTQYTYKIKACNSGGCSVWSGPVSATTELETPATPTNLQAEVNISGDPSTEINLTWSDNSDNEDKFVLYQNGNELASPEANITQYNDTGLASSTTYTYKIKACNNDNRCSGWSSEASETTSGITRGELELINAPDNLNGTVLSATKINLTWDDNSNNEDKFVLYQNGNELASPEANITQYNDTGLASGTTYTYKIKACNSGGCSDLSSEVSETTKALNAFSINGKPTNIRLDNFTQNKICFSWDDNSKINEGYVIETKCETNSWVETDRSSDPNMTRWCQDSLPAGITFHFRVKAWKGESMYSDYSNELTAITRETFCCSRGLWPESWCSFGCSCGYWDLNQ